MGWIRGQARETAITNTLHAINGNKQPTQHIEHLEGTPQSSPSDLEDGKDNRPYPFLLKDVPESEHPFISQSEVSSKRRPNATASKELDHEDKRKDMWVVIDDWVYDCSDFILDHPGGRQVILSFAGEDATWQFHRFHSKRILPQYEHLRIGKTKDAMVRFKEKPKFVGLSRGDEW